MRELELKNFYQLSGFQIDPKTFKLTIQRGTTQPPRNYAPPARQVPTSTTSRCSASTTSTSRSDRRARGHDGKVDGTGYGSGVRAFVDFNNGIVWFPDPQAVRARASAPDARSWFDRVMDLNLIARDCA